MRKRKIFFLFVFLYFFAFRAEAQDAKKYFMGIVDFNALTLLHPNMRDYDANMKAFVKKTDKDYISEKGKNEISDIKKQIGILTKKLNEIDEKTNAKRKDYEYEYRMKTKNVRDEGKLAYEEERLKQNLFYLDFNYEKETQNISKNISGFYERIEEIKKEENKAYTNEEETKLKFLEIRKELKQVIREVASKYKIDVVLNSSSKRIAKAYRQKYKDEFVNETLYERAINAEPFKRKPSEDNSMEEKKYYDYITDIAKKWFKYESHVLFNFDKLFPQNNFLRGGKNLTNEVLLLLYKKYNINERIGKTIIKSNLF